MRVSAPLVWTPRLESSEYPASLRQVQVSESARVSKEGFPQFPSCSLFELCPARHDLLVPFLPPLDIPIGSLLHRQQVRLGCGNSVSTVRDADQDH